MTTEIKVPDIGDFKNVPVIEVLVKKGDAIREEDPLIVLESDKATMEVPSPVAGVVAEVKLKVGDKVGEGSLILTLEGAAAATAATPEAAKPAAAPSPSPADSFSGAVRSGVSQPLTAKSDLHAEVLVLGAGPGGYTAAFRAADLGAKVVLVERWPMLGGVCLNVGCIPSKALLHAAKVIDEAQDFAAHGIEFAMPKVDIDKLRGWKDSVVKRLTGGLAGMAKQRKVTVVTGLGAFASPNTLEVKAADGGKQVISFDKAIIAAGSEPVKLPFIPDDPRVIDSTGALEMQGIPKRLLVLGGGIIGLEMATVYHSLGSKVTVVELLDQIIPGADKDIVAPLYKRIEKRYEKILLKTKVTAVAAEDAGLRVTFEASDGAKSEDVFDKILVAVGRKPNGALIGADVRRRKSRRARLHRGGQADAHQCRAYLRHRRRGGTADAGAQGDT